MERPGLRDLLIAALATLANTAASQAAHRLEELEQNRPSDPQERSRSAFRIVEAALDPLDRSTLERASRVVIQAFLSNEALARFAEEDLDLLPVMDLLRDDRDSRLQVLQSGVYFAMVHHDIGDKGLALSVAEAVHACISRVGEHGGDLDLRAREVLAAARLSFGDVEGAEALWREIHEALDRAGVTGPRLENAQLNLGASLARLGKLEDAIALQQEAFASMHHRQATPLERLEARLMLLGTTARSGRWAEAGEGFGEVDRDLEPLAEDPDRTRLRIVARSGMANSDFYCGRIDAALERFNELLAALPQDDATSPIEREHYLQSLASLKFAKGDIAAARADMLRAIELAGRRMQAMQASSRRAQEAVGREIAQLVWSLLSCRDFATNDRAQDAADLETIVRFRSGAATQARNAARIAARIAAGDAKARELADRLREARLQTRIAAESRNENLTELRNA